MADSSSTQSKPPTDKKPPERIPNISDYIRVFSYATKWDFCIYVVAALASMGAGVTLPLMNVIFGQLVGQFSNYFGEDGGMSRAEFRGTLNRQALIIMGLFLGRWTLNTVNKFCFRMIGIRLSSAIRLHYLQSLFAQSIHVIDSMPPGAPANAITTTSNTLQIGISERLGTFLEFLSTIVGAFVVAFIWSWDLTLVTSSLLLYIIIVLSFCLPLIVKGQTTTLQADAQGTAIASEALGGIRLIMACGAQDHVLARYEKWVDEAMVRAQRMAPVMGMQLGLAFFGVFGAFGLSFWYGSQRYISGAIENAGVVIIVLMSVLMILTSLERVSTPLIAVSKGIVAACELLTVIDMPLPPSGTLKPDVDSGELVFNDVVFEYPSRPGVRVLDELSFSIPSGKNTALVGPSGSGKSTIVGLLERWYSLKSQQVLPQVVMAPTKEKTDDGDSTDQEPKEKEPVEPTLSGSITFDGYDLEDLDLNWWRTQIGLVQQEPLLFNDTIFGNVANGLIGTQWQDEPEERKRELVKEACQEAFASEFIDRLPDGYDTKVGDGGAKLSGGQKQRIAIARSIIKKPRIIILDEATSAIDARSEQLVQSALDRITQNRTTITIAHRLSTIKKADNIVVLKGGRAIEQGNHQSLIADTSSAYSALVKAQSLHMSSDKEGVPATAAADSDTELKDILSHHDQVANPDQITTDQTKMETRPRSIRNSLGALLYEQRWRWGFFVGILLSTAAVAAGTPIQAWLFAQVLENFLMDTEELKKASSFWGLMWLALAAGVGISYFSEGWIGVHSQYSVSATYKRQYFTDMLHQKLSFFDEDSNSQGSLSARVAGDAKKLEEIMGLNLAGLLSGLFTVAGCIIIALVFSWKLGLVAMFVTMPIMLTSGFLKYRYERQFDELNAAVFAESSQFATEAIGAIRTVSALTMEGTINDRYKKLLNGHVDTARRKAQWTSALFGFADSSGLGCQALIFWYGGRLLASGELPFMAFFVCFMAVIQGAESASQVLSVAPNAAQAAAAANRIIDVKESADAQRAKTKDSGNMPETDGSWQIELRDVFFKYPTRNVPIFEGLSLTIEKGQYAAFVGPSGCGKTTIISLLERFYDIEPDHGAILCNDVNINNLGVDEYRRNLSLVAQEPIMFQGTVRDNILFGIPNHHSVPDEKIHQVCRDAFIHDFIISLPDGYNTDVGQKGVSMSGGQKQRIAIARALIRDPKVLLLDEATSALDTESEKTIQAAFERAREGRTMIAVAHRLSTIQSADVIFVFDQGRVVEKGSHDELVKKKGVYYEMCLSQALDR